MGLVLAHLTTLLFRNVYIEESGFLQIKVSKDFDAQLLSPCRRNFPSDATRYY